MTAADFLAHALDVAGAAMLAAGAWTLAHWQLLVATAVRGAACGLIMAFINRHRGGLLKTGRTQLARADFAFIASSLVYWAVGDAQVGLLCFLGFFLGCLAGHGEGMWMGRGGPNDNLLWDTGDLAASGFANFILPAVVLAVWGYMPVAVALVIAGTIGKPAAYYIGNRAHGTGEHGFAKGPELGELLYGAVLGCALGLAPIRTGTFPWFL